MSHGETMRRQMAALRRDALAVTVLVNEHGVVLGEPEVPERSGCENCSWHLEIDGVNVDGAHAYVILGLLADGTYPKGERYVLRPVEVR